jgi:hypothetical protein
MRDTLHIHTEPRMHRQKGASLGHAKPRLEVPIGKSIKFLKIRLSQIMDGENETVGRQKVFLINSNLTLIAYQTLVYILKPTFHFLLDQTGYSLTILGDITTQKLHVGIILDACHSIIPKFKLFHRRTARLDGKRLALSGLEN